MAKSISGCALLKELCLVAYCAQQFLDFVAG